jgi:hypothetical protein
MPYHIKWWHATTQPPCLDISSPLPHHAATGYQPHRHRFSPLPTLMLCSPIFSRSIRAYRCPYSPDCQQDAAAWKLTPAYVACGCSRPGNTRRDNHRQPAVLALHIQVARDLRTLIRRGDVEVRSSRLRAQFYRCGESTRGWVSRPKFPIVTREE